MDLLEEHEIKRSIEDLKEGENDLRLMIAELQKEIDGLDKEKVSWQHFYWILGILMAIIIGIFGVIYSKLEGIGGAVIGVQQDVSFIQGKFEK